MFILSLALCITSNAQAVEQVALKRVKEGEAPEAILNAIKGDFPDPISRTLSLLPAKTYGAEWNVEISEASEEAEPQYYQVEINAKNGNYVAVYDKSGKLLKTKQVIENAELPEKVRMILGTAYKGWKMTGHEERIKNNFGKFDVTYKVPLRKGLKRKTIFFAPDGSIKREVPI